MHIQFASFSLPLSPDSPEETALNLFLRSHTILECQTVMVTTGSGSPRWSVLVHYSQSKPATVPNAKNRIDYKEVLSAEDFLVFDRLRKLRKVLTEREGSPIFAMATNEQLAAMATKRPGSLADLQAIDGFGKAHVDKYGAACLAAIRGDPAEGTPLAGSRGSP
jgi:superfamily II DNA helicase RecQ